MVFIAISMNANAQQNKLEKMGLVSELVYIKYSCEAIVSCNYDTIHHKSANDSLLSLYNVTRITVDQIILQLKADMAVNNSVHYYKKLDKLLTENTISNLDASQSSGKMKAYINGLLNINSVYQNLSNKYPLNKPTANENGNKSILPASTSDVVGIWTAVNATIKQIEDAKATKVTSISTLLESLRLSSVKELVKK